MKLLNISRQQNITPCTTAYAKSVLADRKPVNYLRGPKAGTYAVWKIKPYVMHNISNNTHALAFVQCMNPKAGLCPGHLVAPAWLANGAPCPSPCAVLNL